MQRAMGVISVVNSDRSGKKEREEPSAQRFALACGISPLTNRTSDAHFP